MNIFAKKNDNSNEKPSKQKAKKRNLFQSENIWNNEELDEGIPEEHINQQASVLVHSHSAMVGSSS
jgi:hypothetical protein